MISHWPCKVQTGRLTGYRLTSRARREGYFDCCGAGTDGAVVGEFKMYRIKFLKSASGICSKPSGMTEISLTRMEAMSDLAMTSSFGPDDNNLIRVSVF